MTSSPLGPTVPDWRLLRRQARRRARAGDLHGAAELLHQAALAAEAAGREVEASLLRAEERAAAGALSESIEVLEEAWQLHSPDKRILHRLAAARRALAQREWRQVPCRLYVVSRVGAYRRLAAELPRRDDTVIEIGCAQGLATEHLIAAARFVVALDKAPEMVQRALERLGEKKNLKLLEADGTDPTWPGLFVGRADLVFLDVGGAAPAKQALALARDYRDLYLPRALVIRNLELADFIGAVAYWEGGTFSEWRKPPIPHLEWPWCAETE